MNSHWLEEIINFCPRCGANFPKAQRLPPYAKYWTCYSCGHSFKVITFYPPTKPDEEKDFKKLMESLDRLQGKKK